MSLSQNKINSVTKDFIEIAKEPVTVEFIGGTIYGFTSELGALRLFHRYNAAAHVAGCTAGYSQNLKQWYFSLQFINS